MRQSMLVTVVLLLVCGMAFSQNETAAISGRIVDQTGAVIASAAITVENIETLAPRSTVSNAEGLFYVPGLKAGRYRLTVRKEGFKQSVKTEIMLHVQDEAVENIALQVGAASESVTVLSDAVTINTTDASVSTVVDRQFVENIPMNGRSFQTLIELTPGVVVIPSATNQTGQFSIDGQRSSANSFSVDGVSANTANAPGFLILQASGNLPGLTLAGTTQSLASVDDVQEFKVQTATYSAEYGRQPGGQVSIVTRSGTNQFHGSAFDYLRNDVFDANDWFINRAGQLKPPERQNDFGGTLGGPVVIPRLYDGHDHTFFFFSYEGLRLRQPQFTLTNVPSLSLRQQAPAVMQPLLNAFPLPTGKDLGNGLAELPASYSNASDLDATSIRIDHTLGNRLLFFARYSRTPSDNPTRSMFNLSLINFAKLIPQLITVGATYLISPHVTNDFRINHTTNQGNSGSSADRFGGAVPPPRSILIPSQYDSSTATGITSLNFTGTTSLFSPEVIVQNRYVTDQRQFNLVDNFAFALGSHQVRVGADFRRISPTYAPVSYSLFIGFSTVQQVTSASANSATILEQIGFTPIYSNYSVYAHDTWKVARRLTLDLGLRWEVNPPPSEANGLHPPAVTEISNPVAMQLAAAGTPLWKTTYDNLAPRIGAAYQVSQRRGHETVFRAGFGVYYDTGNDLGSVGFTGLPFFARAINRTIPYPLSASQLAPPSFPPVSVPFAGVLFAFDPNLRLPYTLQWSVAIEHLLGDHQSLAASYVGNAGRRLLQERQLQNVSPNIPFVKITSNTATSDYESLQAQFKRRWSGGLQGLVSYTWSHALDDDSVDNGNIKPVRGNGSYDIRSVLSGAMTYDLPHPNQGRLAKAVLGGWQLDASARAQSAPPVELIARTIVNPVDGNFVGVRPNVNPGIPRYVDDPTAPGGIYVNPAAFSVPGLGQFGDLGRNEVRSPFGAWQIDSALRRQFPITERVALQFRAEAFNLFNHPNFGALSLSLGASNFGQATNMLGTQLGALSPLYQFGGPRSLQFTAKVLF